MDSTQRFWTRPGMIIVIPLLTSCAMFEPTNWGEKNGQLLHGSSGKPISSTTVMAMWKGYVKKGGVKTPLCYHIETTKTNKQGEFSIPAWKETAKSRNIRYKSATLAFYKSGFWTEKVEYEQPKAPGKIFYIEPASKENKQQKSKHRLRYLQQLVGTTGCDLQGNGRSKLTHVYKQILREAKRIAKTTRDKKQVSSLKSWTSFVGQ